jgi:DNA polymerase III alpha subunit
MPKETAQAIYSDWEEFARYGFNKAMQPITALSLLKRYLKTHYTAEYMAALLSANAGKLSRSPYVAEARNMKVPVLAPEINTRLGFLKLRTLTASPISALVCVPLKMWSGGSSTHPG